MFYFGVLGDTPPSGYLWAAAIMRVAANCAPIAFCRYKIDTPFWGIVGFFYHYPKYVFL